MGSKKRGTNSVEDDLLPLENNQHVEKTDSKKKKLKKEKKFDDNEVKNDVGDDLLPLENNHRVEKIDSKKKNLKKEKKFDDNEVKNEVGDVGIQEIPMEKKKKRKMLDKERRGGESKAIESKPVKPVENSIVNMEEDGGGMSVGNDQPVFHIDVFSDLASSNAAKRQAAAEKLAVELMEVQRAFDNGGNREVDDGERGLKLEAERDDGLDSCAESVRYALRRLVRGVSSSRECARQGFALGLTILLTTNLKIRLDSVLKLVDDMLEVTSSMKGQEARDVLLGRLFAFGAIGRSGRLKEEWDSNRNTPLITEFTSLLISLASKKQYLQEPASGVLWDLIEMLPKEAVVSHILDAPGVREWFNGAINSGNPDALFLALRIREKIAIDSNFGPLLPRPFSSRKFFTVEHLTSIANCLKESTFCQPRVHGIWQLLVNMLLPDTILHDANISSSLSTTKKHKKSRKASSSDEESAVNLKIFNEVILEGSLLTGSHDRKHLVFDVVLLMLPRLPASLVPTVLSSKFIQCLMDVLSMKDSWLHKVANHFLTNLSDWVGSDDIRRAFVIVTLQKHSGGRFDSITRTKTVKVLMTGFTSESGCMLFMQKLTSIFIDEDPVLDDSSDQNQITGEDSEMGLVQENGSVERCSESDILKSWVVESLPGLLKCLTLDLEAKAKVQKEVMKFLAVQGLFSATLGTEVTSFELEETFRWPKTPISSALSAKCVDQLQVLLSNAQKAEGSHALTNGLETNDLGYYFMRFLGTFCTIPSVSVVRPLSNEDENAFKTMLDMDLRLSREERNCGLSAGANKVHALRYLLIQLLLQFLLRPGEFTEAASQLVICCQKTFPVNDDPESSEEDESEDVESPKLMDVLVDTLLSLLPQSSASLRYAVEQVFRYFCEDVTDDGLMLMLRVIKKSLKPPRHPNIKEEGKKEDDDDDDEDDLLDIEDADEVAEAGETKVQADSLVDADASDDDDVVSDAEDDDDNDDDNDDMDDDVDHDMDDEAMFRLDVFIARKIKEHKNKTGPDSPHGQLVLFKLRVLSLVEIYLHENPDSPKVLTVYSNLVQAFVNPNTTDGSEQLAQRIWGILQKKIFKAKDYPKGENVQLSTLETLLTKSLHLASRPLKQKHSVIKDREKKQASLKRYQTICSLAQQCTHWILKIIDGRKFPETQLDNVLEIFKNSLEKYFAKKKKSQLKLGFLKEVIKRRPWVGQLLFAFILEKCGNTTSDYRRVEALDLLQELFRSISGQTTLDVSKKILEPHLSKLSHIVHQLAENMPVKQARITEVIKFSGKVFQIVSTHNLAKPFLKTLDSDALDLCESQFGDAFLTLMKTEN